MTLKEYVKIIGFIPISLLFFILIDPFDKGHFFAYLLIIYFLLLKKDQLIQSLDKDSWFLLLFSISYTAINMFGDHSGVQVLVMQAFLPFFFYLIGKQLIIKTLSKENLVLLIVTLGILYGASAMVSVFKAILESGFKVSLLDRDVANIWTGDLIKATGMSALLIYNMILPGIIIANKKRLSLFSTIIIVAIFIISMLCNFRLGSRTGVMIAALTLVFSFVYILYFQSAKNNIKFIAKAAIIVFLIIQFVPFDMDADYLSVLGDRLKNPHGNSSASAGGRTDLWENAINNLFKHPFGWKHGRLSHNLWLDNAKVTGILPLILLIIFNVFNIKNFRKIISDKNSDLGINTTIILIMSASFLQFFVEPIYQGSFFLFSFYCLLQGVIKKYMNLLQQKNIPQ